MCKKYSEQALVFQEVLGPDPESERRGMEGTLEKKIKRRCTSKSLKGLPFSKARAREKRQTTKKSGLGKLIAWT